MNLFIISLVLLIIGIVLIYKRPAIPAQSTDQLPPSNARRILGFVLILPLVYVLLFTSPFSGTKHENTNPTATYTNDQYGFKIDFDKPFYFDESHKNGDVVEFTDSTADVQEIITINFVKEASVNNSTFEAYVNKITQRISKTLGGELIGNKQLNTAKNTYLTEYRVRIDQRLLHYIQLTVLSKDGQVFIVSGMSDDSSWLKYGEGIKNALLSFSTI